MTHPVKHVCLFRLKRPLTTAETARLNEYSTAMRRAHSAILDYVFTSNGARKSAGFTLVLYSEFTTAGAIRDYVNTPLHDELAEFMNGFVEETIVADF